MAGKGGMNLTHSEPAELFVSRYAERRSQIELLLRRFDATALRAWVHGLGVETFVGSSGRVFPTDMKAAPMLREEAKRPDTTNTYRTPFWHVATRIRRSGAPCSGCLQIP